MQDSNPIMRLPILIGLLLSIAAHAALMRESPLYTPAMPQMKTGRTVVHLTLVPNTASSHSAPAEAARTTMPPAEPTVSPKPATADTRSIEPEPADSAPETDATPEADKGITSEAMATSAFHPAYPRISRRRGEEGTVQLSVQVLSNGSAGNITIVQSSGYRRLDEAAMDGARKTTFLPARLLDRTIDSTINLSYTFRLTHD